MRLDSDVAMVGEWPDIFSIMKEKGAVYMSEQGTAELAFILPGR